MADAAKGFFGGLLRASAGALASTVTSSSVLSNNPHFVQEISRNTDEVARYPVFQREPGTDGFVILHGPMEIGNFTFRTTQWVIIAHQPMSSKMWSLYRSNNKEEAVKVFTCYRNVLSVLINCDAGICDKHILEKICSKLRDPKCSGWTAAHIAAAFDYYKFFKNPQMKKYINVQSGPMFLAPIHVAIEAKNFNSVLELINAGASLDLKDLKDNNVIHHASKSTPTILKYIMDNLPPRYSPIVNDANRDGMTPLSIACKINLAENVQTLLRCGSDINVPTPKEGYPITIAVKSDSVLSIQELIAHSAEQLNVRDPQDGTSPLHWATGAETLNMLLDLGSDPNIPNNTGQTPLHIQARRGSLKGTLGLLCHHAFPDLKDAEGDTPMHYAARLCSKVVLQVLIAFDADVNLVNNRGESPRHLISTSQRSDMDNVLFYLDAVGAKRCPPSLQQHCTRGCKYNESFGGIPPETYYPPLEPSLVHQALYAFSSSREVLARSRRASVESEIDMDEARNGVGARGSCVRNSLLDAHIGGRVLCLDGGGIRGLVLTQILMYMQKEFGVPIVELFDWISGTSTGGILALCLASGKSPVEIQALYLRLKDKVFTGERPYSVEKMEEFMKQEFGSDTKMSNIHRPRLLITTAIANHRPADFHFFRNFLSPAVIVGECDFCTRSPEELYVWEVAKATGAAPSYFRLDGKYIDGGLVANNPTLDVLTELTQMSAVFKATGETSEVEAKLPSVVVSLGTGIQPKVKAQASHYDISRPNGFFDAIVKAPKIANIIALLVEQSTQAEGQVVERARAWCSSIGVPYFRFSPTISDVVDLDETSDEVLVNMMWETRAYIYSHHGSVVELKRLLFANGSPPPP